MRVILIMTKYAFYKFHRDFKKFNRMSLDSKYNEMNDFYALLNALVNTHEATTTETKNRKFGIVKNVKQLKINTSILTKKTTIVER